MDATITTRSVQSFAELSLAPVFRRQWSSRPLVLGRGQLPAEALMKLYAQHLPQPPQNTQLVLAGDHTAWSRLWSPTLKERTYEHQPQNRPGAGPVTVGQGYSTIVCIPQMQGTWALPLVHERITSFETPLEKAALHVWSHLMPLMSWQLWLGSHHVRDNPLPWQKPLTHQTPGRVANAFASILVNIGTPAMLPKRRGKSPGWPTGQVRTPRPRFPTVKKSYSRPRSKTRVSG